jgi:uncharacterized membrane protein YedE/YeeE
VDVSPLLEPLAVGVVFGVVLERAGLGDARKLTAQFRLSDLTVLKVMFTAIATAALGLYWLGALGLVDVAALPLTPTHLLPQVAGGLVFGLGFVVGGYCPGTSCVAAASGRGDAVALLAGIAAGTLVFGELFPAITGLYAATPLGRARLPETLGVPEGIAVLGVVLLALAAFAAAERIERRAGGTER